jgi:hypothetical protein
MRTILAALAAAILAVGMAACNRDNNAGAGSSAKPDRSATGSAAGGSSAPASPQSPSKPSKY